LRGAGRGKNCGHVLMNRTFGKKPSDVIREKGKVSHKAKT